MPPLWRTIRTAQGNEFNMHPPIQQLSPCLCLREIPKGTGRGRDMAESSAAWAAGGKAGLHPWGIKKLNEEEPPAAVRGGTPDDPHVCAQISVFQCWVGGGVGDGTSSRARLHVGSLKAHRAPLTIWGLHCCPRLCIERMGVDAFVGGGAQEWGSGTRWGNGRK